MSDSRQAHHPIHARQHREGHDQVRIMSEIIGIDLGTTLSIVARLNSSGKPEIVHNDDGGNLTPSAVEVTGPDRSCWVVGGEAKRKLFGADPRALGGFKRYMGKGHSYDTAAGPITPTDLSAAVLSSLRRQAEKKGPIGSAVVTVPANFGTEARVATTEAAKLAGLNCLLSTAVILDTEIGRTGVRANSGGKAVGGIGE